MNGSNREVIEYLQEPLPDEEEWPCCDGDGIILDPYDILPPEICLVCSGFNGECGEHCEVE